MQKRDGFSKKACLTNIQRFCLNDGPGIRTVVFLKGCPLSCTWCSNPECQSLEKNILHKQQLCILCVSCVNVCHKNAIIKANDEIQISSDDCDYCGSCVEVCPTKSIEIIGYECNLEELWPIIMKDKIFYDVSGGGVTFSGGEPLLYPEFISSVFALLKKYNIGTAIETSGYADWSSFQTIMKYTDHILYDLKHVDDIMHKKITGVNNGIILDNLQKLQSMQKNITLRIPLIPKHNMNRNNINKVIDIANQLKIKEINVLPYHRYGQYKYSGMQKAFRLKKILPSQDREIEEIVKYMSKKTDAKIIIGG